MPAEKNVTKKHRDLARAFICAQRRVRALDRDDADPLPMAEFHTLIALEQSGSLTPGEIARLLHINLSKASRIIQRLEGDRLITISPLKEDARQKGIELTKKGGQLLRECDTLFDRRTSAWFDRLSKAHRQLLKEFLASLAKALGAPEEPRKRDEVEIRAYQRRIARAGGLLGGPALAGELNLIEYQILNFLIEQPDVAMEKLFELPFDRAQISRTSDLLHRLGLLNKSRDAKDSRRILARLTDKGKKDFLRAEEKTARIIANATSRFVPHKHDTLLKVLELIAR